MKGKTSIYVCLMILMSIFVHAAPLETTQKLNLVIEFEEIKVNLGKIAERVDKLADYYDSAGNDDKAKAWSSVHESLNTAEDKIDEVLDSLKREDVEAEEISAMTGDFYTFLDEIFSAAVSAAKGVAYNGHVSMLKTDEGEKKTPAGDYGSVRLDFYVMSQCPYGVQVEDAIKPVLDDIGDSVDFNLNFIANDLGGGKFASLHGQNEVDGDIIQLCAISHEPQKYMNLIVCMNKNAGAIPGNWEACAKDNGLDAEKIKDCFESDEGKLLLSKSIGESEEANARGSPTIFVAGQAYQGSRDSLAFKRALCAHLEGHPECGGIPVCAADVDCPQDPKKISKCENPNTENAKCTFIDPVPLEVIVLNDPDCESCDTENIMATTFALFKGTEQRDVDVNSEEGKSLSQKYNLQFVPVYIFGDGLTDTYTWNNQPSIRTAFQDLKDGSFRLLDSVTGASHFISEEKKTAFFESIGVSLGDNRPQIDFYVMSYCPYGNQAEEGIEPVFQLLMDKADFNPRYVIYSNYGGGGPNYCMDEENKYCSMHGIQELNQDIRELCVNKYMGTEAYFEFILGMNDECTSQNADTCWKGVAEGLDLDVDKISSCEDEEGIELAAEELRMNKLLSVSGSPTVFIDGEKYQGGRTPEDFKNALCAAFEDAPEECDEDLSGASSGAAPATGSC